jgi:hypothetical protein
LGTEALIFYNHAARTPSMLPSAVLGVDLNMTVALASDVK